MNFQEIKSIFITNLRSIEIFLLLENKKPCIRISVYDKEKESIENFCKTNHLNFEISDFKIVQITDKGKGGFSNKGYIVDKNSPHNGYYYYYISKNSKTVSQAKEAEKKQDDNNLGKALGYPQCCIDFFLKNKEIQQKEQNDYIIPIIKNSKEKNFWQNNICTRYFDISILSHFPCSFDCINSKKLANKYFKSLKKIINPTIFKSIVIYTEYKGIFIIIPKNKNNNTIFYDTIYYTIQNEIYKTLKNSNELIILSQNSIKIKNKIIENIYMVKFI